MDTDVLYITLCVTAITNHPPPIGETLTMRHARLSIVVLLLWHASAIAISCDRASTKAEKLICADPVLVRLDQDLNSTYNNLLGNVAEKYTERVREAQKDWILWRNELIDARLAQGVKPDLDQLLRERIDELRNAIIDINTLIFLRLRNHQRPMYLLTERPGTEAYNRWVDKKWREVTVDNKNSSASTSKINCQDDCEPMVIVWRVFSLDFASPEMISVHESIISDGGGAHPSNEDVHHNMWLSKSGIIPASEIFNGTSYRKVIAHYVAEFYSDMGADYIAVEGEDQTGATKPENWGIRANALHVTGQGYDYNIGRGFVEIDVPWSAFGDGLNADFKERLKRYNGATPAFQL